MSEHRPSKKSGDLDAALYHASRYRALAKVGHSLSGYETSAVAMLEEIERLQEDVSRYESGRVVLTGEIDTLKQKLIEAQQLAMRQANEIRKLRAGERA